MISKQTAYDIAVAFEAIENTQKLIAEVNEEIRKSRDRGFEPVRDHFGRAVQGIRLELPTGQGSHRIFNVSWELSLPVLKAHLADRIAHLEALQIQAAAEARSGAPLAHEDCK